MMSTSQGISILAEPQGTAQISQRSLGYVAEAARDAMFDVVVRACIESGVSKATLAKRLKKDPAQVSRLLGAPGNWTIDTCAELLFAIDGSMLSVDRFWPMQEAKSNMRSPACFADYSSSSATWSEIPAHIIVNTSVYAPAVAAGSSVTEVEKWKY